MTRPEFEEMFDLRLYEQVRDEFVKRCLLLFPLQY